MAMTSDGENDPRIAELQCAFNWNIGHCLFTHDTLIRDLQKLAKFDFTVVSRCLLATLSAEKREWNEALNVLEDQQWQSVNSNSYRRSACQYITESTKLIINLKRSDILYGIDDQLAELNSIWTSSGQVRSCIFFMKGIVLSIFGLAKRKEASMAFREALSELNYSSLSYDTLELHEEVSKRLEHWEQSEDSWNEVDSGIFSEPMNFPKQINTPGDCVEAVRFRRKIEKHIFVRGLLSKSRPEDFFDFLGKSKSQGLLLGGSALTIASLPIGFKIFVRRKNKEYMSYPQEGDVKRRLYTEFYIADQLLTRFEKAVPNPRKSGEIKRRAQNIDDCYDLFCYEMLRHINEIFSNNATLYFRLATLYPYNNDAENMKAIKYLKKARKEARNCGGSVWIDLELVNRRAMTKSKEWVRTEYRRLHQTFAGDSNILARVKLKKSQWLLHLADVPNSDSLDCMDEAVYCMEEAKVMDKLLVFPSTFLSHLYELLRSRRSDRPELYAWYCAYFSEDELSLEGILRDFQSVMLGGDDVSDKRKYFAIEQIGHFLMQQSRFNEAYNMYSQLPDSNIRRKWLITRAVIEDFDQDVDLLKPSNDEIDECLMECLKMGNCDVIERILIKWELRKGSSELKQEIFEESFFEQSHDYLFFSEQCYVACATIENVIEQSSRTFFLEEDKTVNSDFINQVKDRVSRLLEIPSERPEIMNELWRKRRLDMTKMYLSLSGADHSDWTHQEIFALNIKVMDTLRDSRNALDQTITQILRLKDNCSYPLIHKKLNNYENNELKKSLKGKDVTEEDRTLFREQRMKTWLKKARQETEDNSENNSDFLNPTPGETSHNDPSEVFHGANAELSFELGENEVLSEDVTGNSQSYREEPFHSSATSSKSGENKKQKNKKQKEMKKEAEGKPEETLYEIIAGLAKLAFRDKINEKNRKLGVLIRREHHLIKKESAWHYVWLEFVNKDKHAAAWDMSEFEQKLNELRKISSEGNSYVTAYEVAHFAAIFAEQTRAVLVD